MPKNPDSEGSPVLLTIDQIAAKHRVSRSSVHTYRRGGTFPRPVPVEGTTRVLFDAAEVAAWFKANPKRQGNRTDIHSQKPKQGEPVSTTVDPRLALMSALNDPPYDDVAGKRGTSLDEAAQLLDAHRAAVVAEVVDALTAKGTELSELAEEEMRPSLEERAQTWYEAAGVAERIARKPQG